MVYPFIAQGSILDFFSRPENKDKSEQYLLRWASDIARGLNHMHTHNAIHQSLVVENILIDAEGKTIIGNLSLVRPPFQKGEAVPLGSRFCTPAFDVLMYGLVLFEIATACTDLKFRSEYILQSKQAFHRAKIDQCPIKEPDYTSLIKKLPSFLSQDSPIVQLMLRCLSFDPSSRPTPSEIKSLVSIMVMDDVITKTDKKSGMEKALDTKKTQETKQSRYHLTQCVESAEPLSAVQELRFDETAGEPILTQHALSQSRSTTNSATGQTLTAATSSKKISTV